jgi:hypothetical protein
MMSDWRDRDDILSPGTFRDEDDARAWIRRFLNCGESDDGCYDGRWLVLVKPPDGALVASEIIGCTIGVGADSETTDEILRGMACYLVSEADKLGETEEVR